VEKDEKVFIEKKLAINRPHAELIEL